MSSIQSSNIFESLEELCDSKNIIPIQVGGGNAERLKVSV